MLWRSGVALAHEIDGMDLDGLRLVELGCGLGLPSIAAARAGARVLATDGCDEAVELVGRNARLNRVRVETAAVNWTSPAESVTGAPFDVVLAADVLYGPKNVAPLLTLLPHLAPQAWLAEPGRPAAADFIERASETWRVETRVRGVVRIHRLLLGEPIS